MQKQTQRGRIVFEIRKERIINDKRVLEQLNCYDTEIEEKLMNLQMEIKEGLVYITIEVHSAKIFVQKQSGAGQNAEKQMINGSALIYLQGKKTDGTKTQQKVLRMQQFIQTPLLQIEIYSVPTTLSLSIGLGQPFNAPLIPNNNRCKMIYS